MSTFRRPLLAPRLRTTPVLLAWLIVVVVALCAVPSAQAQDKFRSRNWRVCVALEENLRRLVVRGAQDYIILSDSMASIGQLRAGETYFIDIIEGQPGARTYRLVLREYNSHQVREAIELASQAKDRYQLSVKVFRIPSRDPEGDRILVTLGEFGTLEEARAHVNSLAGERITLIYEDRAAAVRGQVRLYDRNGTILARDPSRLRLSPVDPADGDLTLAVPKGSDWSVNVADARRYRGDIDLMINEDGTLTVVNDLWIEHYLYSVVSAEIGPTSPMEALKAQAVAARTFAVAKIERGVATNSFFDFYDTTITQAYPGRQVESQEVKRAVDETRGQILIHEGEPIDAVYSHSCGGYVASSEEVWGGTPDGYFFRHPDRLDGAAAPDLSNWSQVWEFLTTSPPALCNPNQPGFPEYARRYYRWEKRFTGEEFTRQANARYGTGTVRDVVIDTRTPSGRVRSVRIIGSRKTVTITRELEMRAALGDINSTLFALGKDIDDEGNLKSLRIVGGGFGHGVGMCQVGALTMARQGYNYRQILAFYYRDVKMRTLYR